MFFCFTWCSICEMFGCFCDDVCFGDVFLGLVFLLPEGLPCLQLIWRFPASYTRNH